MNFFLKKLLILLSCMKLVIGKCSIGVGSKSIECYNVSTENYFYEILKSIYLFGDVSFKNGLNEEQGTIITNISITQSSLPHIKRLQHPSSVPQYFAKLVITTLAVTFSKIHIIEPYALNEFRNITILDLSNNNIKDISFTFELNVLRRLTLASNQISAENLDLTYFKQSLAIDLSHNNITEIYITCNGATKEDILLLNLSFNKIKNVSFSDEICVDLDINLKQNKNILPLNRPTSVSGLHISFISKNVPLNLYGMDIFNVSNTEISHLTKQIFYAKSSLNLVDFRNCSLVRIDTDLFRGIKINSLLLNNNNLTNVFKPIFNESIIHYLDISNSSLINVNRLFAGLFCVTLSLKKNKIKEVSLKSFNEIKFIESIDLSLNQLDNLKNSSFVNCHGLKSLNVSYNQIVIIDVLAFYSLESLEVLDLSFNKLTILKAGIFSSLTSLLVLNVKNNFLKHICYGVFYNLPIRFLNLNNNLLSIVDGQVFYNLRELKGPFKLMSKNIKSNAFINIGFQSMEIDQAQSLNFSQNLVHNELLYLTMVNSESLILQSNTFSDLINLKQLRISNSTVEFRNFAFFGLFNLDNLSFYNSNILKFEKHCFKGLFNLKVLDAKALFQNVKTIEQGIFDDMHSMTELDLGDLNLMKIENRALIGLRSLKFLSLKNNKLGTLLNNTFLGLSHLNTLNLSFSNVIDFENFTFYGLHNLGILDLQGNNLKNLSDLKFAMDSLQEINFENCKISTLSKNVFQHLKNLKVLNLKNNLIDQIEDMHVDSFAHTPNLLSLNLANNFIEGFDVGIFSNLGKLKILDLSKNNITKFSVEPFVPLKSLEVLNIDNNHLKTLNILQFLPYAKELKFVGISQNKLPCDKLAIIIKDLRKKGINYKTNQPFYEVDNIEGIECVDVCKFLFCLKDTHGIN